MPFSARKRGPRWEEGPGKGGLRSLQWLQHPARCRQGSGQAAFRQQHGPKRMNRPEMALEATDGLSVRFRKRQMVQTQSCRGAIWITRTSV